MKKIIAQFLRRYLRRFLRMYLPAFLLCAALSAYALYLRESFPVHITEETKNMSIEELKARYKYSMEGPVSPDPLGYCLCLSRDSRFSAHVPGSKLSLFERFKEIPVSVAACTIVPKGDIRYLEVTPRWTIIPFSLLIGFWYSIFLGIAIALSMAIYRYGESRQAYRPGGSTLFSRIER